MMYVNSGRTLQNSCTALCTGEGSIEMFLASVLLSALDRAEVHTAVLVDSFSPGAALLVARRLERKAKFHNLTNQRNVKETENILIRLNIFNCRIIKIFDYGNKKTKQILRNSPNS